MEQLTIRIGEAAVSLGISKAKMYQLIKTGEIPALRVGKTMRISTDVLREWVRQRPQVNAGRAWT
jgi:excisionase family DNA binding protein